MYNVFSLSRNLARPGWEPLKVVYHPAKFGNSGDCGSEDMMLLEVEEKDFKCPHLNPPLLFISKSLEADGMLY